jgi:hypothetical protein
MSEYSKTGNNFMKQKNKQLRQSMREGNERSGFYFIHYKNILLVRLGVSLKKIAFYLFSELFAGI